MAMIDFHHCRTLDGDAVTLSDDDMTQVNRGKRGRVFDSFLVFWFFWFCSPVFFFLRTNGCVACGDGVTVTHVPTVNTMPSHGRLML